MKKLVATLIALGILSGLGLAKFSYKASNIGEFLTWFCVSLLLICGGGLIAIIQINKHKSD